MTRALSLVALLPLLLGLDLLSSPNRAVEQGNARMRDGKAEEALVEYDRAAKEMPADPAVRFNRGTALYQLGRYPDAIQEFLRATEAKNPALKASAFYNLGNSFFKAEKYADAVAAYRRALAFDPNDLKAKWNLELALKKKKEEDEKKKGDDKQDQQKKNDDKSQQQKESSNKPGDDAKDQQGGKDKPPEGKQDQGKPEEGPQPQPPPQQEQAKKDPAAPPEPAPAAGAPPPGNDRGPSREEIEAILDGLERSPKDLEKERAKMRAVRRARPAKDW